MADIFDLSRCILCPRECKAERTNENSGICGASDKIRIARASLHAWEEPCLSGRNGSGTVFFTGCNLGCVFCQNSEISHKNKGYEVSKERLCEIFFELKEKGAHNINLVTAVHYLPMVLDAVKSAKQQKINIPFVYNSSGYEKAESLAFADGLIDIYLPDFKYLDRERSKRYSKAADYPEVATSAIDEMVRQRPKCVFDEAGILQSGVIIRHLLLPDGLLESKKIIKYLYEKYADNIFISIMSQYTPFGELKDFPELKNKVRSADYEKLVDYAIKIGVTNAFIQDGSAAEESFIPDFSGQGVIEK
ncbi:MAG: radical SAM protein [Clostridia bacterium]|nr:radical SAM protein [Clostridia bacterium]